MTTVETYSSDDERGMGKCVIGLIFVFLFYYPVSSNELVCVLFHIDTTEKSYKRS